MDSEKTTQESHIYCFDTNVYINWFHERYPPDVIPTLWTELEKAIDSGKIVSPDEVKNELEVGGDGVSDWAKKQPKLFVRHNQAIEKRVIEIAGKHPNLIDPKKTRFDADPFVIALAQEINATVVTYEKRVGPGAKLIKIPNVCDVEGVRTLTPIEVLRELKIKI